MVHTADATSERCNDLAGRTARGLRRLRTYPPVRGTADEDGLWSVTCFAVRVGQRKRGFAEGLLDGASSSRPAQHLRASDRAARVLGERLRQRGVGGADRSAGADVLDGRLDLG